MMQVVRTDLAIESLYTHQDDGILQEQEQTDSLTVTRIAVTTENAAQLVGKPMGKFVTLESDALFNCDPTPLENSAKVLSTELKKLLPSEFQRVLVVGLGNRNITPDALGPSVLERVMITNHMMGYLPTEDGEDFSAVGAFAPGVLGITGLETVEIVKGVVERFQPSVVLAVDALCAASPGRMFTTVQLTDTGIHPGSGVGNRREGLNQESLGVPVIAIGIPTVVDANAIVHTTLQRFFEANESLAEADNMIGGILQHGVKNMFVSPKDIDNLIARSARVVAGGINLALHQNIDLSFAEQFVS